MAQPLRIKQLMIAAAIEGVGLALVVLWAVNILPHPAAILIGGLLATTGMTLLALTLSGKKNPYSNEW
ncbi:MAG: hypothetical protein EXS00_06270 [Phycisphaerales bacterium]|nr:hypothetical protein [Phycisphaerales bacterium]